MGPRSCVFSLDVSETFGYWGSRQSEGRRPLTRNRLTAVSPSELKSLRVGRFSTHVLQHGRPAGACGGGAAGDGDSLFGSSLRLCFLLCSRGEGSTPAYQHACIQRVIQARLSRLDQPLGGPLCRAESGEGLPWLIGAAHKAATRQCSRSSTQSSYLSM